MVIYLLMIDDKITIIQPRYEKTNDKIKNEPIRYLPMFFGTA